MRRLLPIMTLAACSSNASSQHTSAPFVHQNHDAAPLPSVVRSIDGPVADASTVESSSCSRGGVILPTKQRDKACLLEPDRPLIKSSALCALANSVTQHLPVIEPEWLPAISAFDRSALQQQNKPCKNFRLRIYASGEAVLCGPRTYGFYCYQKTEEAWVEDLGTKILD